MKKCTCTLILNKQSHTLERRRKENETRSLYLHLAMTFASQGETLLMPGHFVVRSQREYRMLCCSLVGKDDLVLLSC